MNQALQIVERLRVEWLVHELGSLAEQRRARGAARRLFREAGGMAGSSCWREPEQVNLAVWCADGSACIMQGYRDEGGQVVFTQGFIGDDLAPGDDLAAKTFREWGPYDASDPHLAAWLLSLVT